MHNPGHAKGPYFKVLHVFNLGGVCHAQVYLFVGSDQKAQLYLQYSDASVVVDGRHRARLVGRHRAQLASYSTHAVVCCSMPWCTDILANLKLFKWKAARLQQCAPSGFDCVLAHRHTQIQMLEGLGTQKIQAGQ